ncbi:MAG: sulfatase-like hydrolase/transferase [Rikenellaceae bacterium]
MKKTLLLGSYFAVGVGMLYAGDAKRPNILFVIADDQDAATLGVYGDKEVDTPVLDKLASEGVTLTNAYQMGSYIGGVSVASRTMIMTGRNVWEAQKLQQNQNKYEQLSGNAAIVDPSAPEYNSLPALFYRAGYETFRTCKMGNSYNAANVLFEQRYDKTCRQGDDENGSTWHADNAIKYFNDRSELEMEERKPFLMYLGFSHPHDPRNGRPELLEKYGAKNVEVPTEINEKTPALPISYLPEKTFHDGHPDLRDEVAVFGVMERRDEITVRNEIGKEYACIENIDTQLGRVLEALEATGELDNTYIIYTSDHGIAVGKHAYMGKQNLFNHTYKVPFIVKGPGVLKNKLREGNTYLMDVLPFLCDLADIDVPDVVEGKSFKSVIEGDSDVIRDVMYGVYCGGTKPGIRTVVKGDWKLIKYDVLDGTVRETLLFNTKDNPNELMEEHHKEDVIAMTGNKPKAKQVNLASDPKYADKLAEMEALLLEQMIEQRDPYRLWNQPAM